ncbi:hypothetical protein [Mesorhizobium sp. Z1-4]|uniref:hypothetical protein n=1 Tax=Mesorhizobium sp. Z1-4 TaxID=2448478 RepID=UPI000FD94C23|nr:hypothetical protein [Mesorhizobium sp. Z1-4]
MDARRLKRLTKLVQVQRQIQALHETRHANHLASSVAAEKEAHELIEGFDSGALSSTLFPDLYHNRISSAFARRDQERDLAAGEVKHVVSATLRADKIDQERQQAARVLEEKSEERLRLERAAHTGKHPK